VQSHKAERGRSFFWKTLARGHLCIARCTQRTFRSTDLAEALLETFSPNLCLSDLFAFVGKTGGKPLSAEEEEDAASSVGS
jgi:hypothetical protein